MSLDWPAFGDALWLVSDETGIRPEWQLPVLSLETGGTFDPSIVNSIGCVGINQFCPSSYPRYVHVPVREYRSWSASMQLSGPVLNFWRNAVAAYGPIRSATKLMLAQFGVPTISKPLTGIVFSAPSREYQANCPTCPCGLDPACKGYITVQDVANTLSRQARTAKVREAIAKAYTMRPEERPFDPVYGLDFGGESPIEIINPPTRAGPGKVLAAMGVITLAGAAGFGAYTVRGRR